MELESPWCVSVKISFVVVGVFGAHVALGALGDVDAKEVVGACRARKGVHSHAVNDCPDWKNVIFVIPVLTSVGDLSADDSRVQDVAVAVCRASGVSTPWVELLDLIGAEVGFGLREKGSGMA